MDLNPLVCFSVSVDPAVYWGAGPQGGRCIGSPGWVRARVSAVWETLRLWLCVCGELCPGPGTQAWSRLRCVWSPGVEGSHLQVPSPHVSRVCPHAPGLGVQARVLLATGRFPWNCACEFLEVGVHVCEGLTVNAGEAQPTPPSLAGSSSPCVAPLRVVGGQGGSWPTGGVPASLTSASQPGRELAGAWGRKGAPHSGVRREALWSS